MVYYLEVDSPILHIPCVSEALGEVFCKDGVDLFSCEFSWCNDGVDGGCSYVDEAASYD